MRPTYASEVLSSRTEEAVCPLCGKRAALRVHRLRVRVKLSFLIPFGVYEDHAAECPACMRRYQISADLRRAEIPSRSLKLFGTLSFLIAPFPVLGTITSLIVLNKLPVTSNDERQWAKLGLTVSFFGPAVFVLYVLARFVMAFQGR